MKHKNIDTVRFSFEDLRGLSDYKKTADEPFIRDLGNVYKKMLQLTYREENEEEIRYFVLFQGFAINKKNKYVEISVNPKLEYILNQLSSEFTQFELQEFTELSSSYSKTMYRLLKQYKSTGWYIVKMEEFREILDIPDSYKMGNIDQQILNPVKKELAQYFEPFEIKKIKSKKGNRIEFLKFKFQEKQHNGDLPYIPMHNWLKD